MKCNFNEITSFSAKLHGSFKTAASVYAIIGASSYPRANIMTISAPTAPNPMVLVESRRSMFKSACWAVLGLAIVAMADFALAQLAHVGPTAAKEFAQRSALLAQAGDREGAVEASRNAVDTYRRLVHRNAAPYEPGLAASLHDLSRRLSEAGDAAGARAAVEEAIVMRRRLARYGARYAGGLAKSLELRTSIEMAAPASVKTSNAMR
jgi:hypothetical protein